MSVIGGIGTGTWSDEDGVVPTTPGGGWAVGARYVHLQPTPATIWDIEHAMSCHPSVTIVDTADDMMIAAVRYVSLDRLVVEFTAPTAGRAFLN